MQTLVVFVQWQRYENFWNLQAFSDENHEIISFRKSSVCISITYGLKIIFISVFVFRYSIRFACFCLSCYLLLYIVVYSLCICLLRGASPWILVVCCALDRLISSCIVSLVVLSPAVGCRAVRGVLWHVVARCGSVACLLSVVPAGCSLSVACRACS